MNKTTLIGLFIFLSFCTELAAAPLYPHYPYRRYTVDDGLPQSSVLAIAQDTRGFVWFATNEGVVRFDGHEFKVYNMGSGYPFRMVDGVVARENGKVWISTYINGLWEIDGVKAERVFVKGLNKSALLNFLEKTSDGEILLGAEPGGLFVIRGDSIKQFADGGKPLKGQVITAAKDYKGNYWVGTFRDGVQVIRKGKVIKVLKEEQGVPSNEIRTILPLQNGQVWIGTPNGLFSYPNRSTGQKINEQYPQMYIANLYSNDAKNIWMNVRSNPGGVFHFQSEKLTEILKYNASFFSKSILIDKNGVLFVGGLRSLLVFPDLNFQQFGQKDGLNDSYIKSIGKDKKGIIWIGTSNDGLYQYTNGLIVKYDRYNEIFKSNSIYSVIPIKNEIWLGTSHGLFILKNGRLRNTKITNFFQDIVIRRIFYTADKKIIILLKKRIYLIENDRLSDITYNLDHGYHSFWGLHKDKSGIFWLATNGQGLWRLKAKQWQQVAVPDSQKIFYAVRTDREGNLYFPSANGLYHWDGKRLKKIIDIGRTIWDVLPVHSTNIWLLTSRGLLHFENGRTTVFNHLNGFITSEFNMGALFYENEFSQWFGGVDGLIHYQKKLEYPQVNPVFYITSIQAKDTLITFPCREKIVFRPDQRDLRFKFTAINYKDSKEMQFTYHLEGFERAPKEIKNEYTLNYTNLNDGKYTLHILYKDQMNPNFVIEKKVSFEILRPWWKMLWARFLFILIVMAILYALIRWRLRILENRNAMLERRIEDRTKDIQESYRLLKREMNERLRTQKELHKEREQLAVTLKFITDGVVRTDKLGKVILLNNAAAKLCGVPMDIAVAKNINDVLALYIESDGRRINLPDDVMQKKSMTDIHVITAVLKDKMHNMERIIALSWASVQEQEEGQGGYVWIFRDISAERELEKEFLKSQKLESIGLLAGGIAHDFNNILSGILGNAQLAAMAAKSGKSLEKYLSGIEEATKNAASLTQQLLTFSKGGKPVKELISLKELLVESVDFALRGSTVKGKLDIPADLWMVEADPGQINQVINNLTINAVQSMPGGGMLKISANNIPSLSSAGEEALPLAEGRYIKITCTDTGIGIPKENLTHIFDPYFTTKQKGSGLGLATTHAIIKKHNGLIRVKSTLGRGTTFEIYLPASDRQRVKESKHEQGLVDWQGKKALVMDDEPYIRELLQDFLEMLGFEVVTAGDGKETIELYEKALRSKAPIDVLILDLTIRGGLGGKETSKKIKELNPNAKIIVASGYSTDSILADYKEYGFAARLSKPFTIEEINKVLLKVL